MESQRAAHVIKAGFFYLVIGLVAMFAGATVGGGNFTWLLVIALVLGLWGAWWFRSWLPMLAVAFMSMPHRGPLLRGLGYWEILVLGCVALFSLDRILSKRYMWPFNKPNWTLVLMTLALSIIPLHFIATKLHFGSPTGGGIRLSIYTVAVLVFCWMITSGFIPLKHMRWLPWAAILPGLYLFASDVATFVKPEIIPYMNLVYPVNEDAVQGYILGGLNQEMFRLRGTRELGLGLLLLTCAYMIAAPPQRLVVRTLVVLATLPVAAVMMLVSGFRSSVMAGLIVVCLACLWRARVLLLMLGVAALMGLTGLSLYQSHVQPLPLTVQRAVCWFPGDWDNGVVHDSKFSNRYRIDLWNLWFDREFPHVWLIGQGQQNREAETNAVAREMFDLQLIPYSPAIGAQLYFNMVLRNILTQNHHNGLVGLIDYTGVIGALFFILATLRGSVNCYRIFRSGRRLETWQAWVILFILQKQYYFWTTGLIHMEIANFAVSFTLVEMIVKSVRREAVRTPVRQAVPAPGWSPLRPLAPAPSPAFRARLSIHERAH